MHDTIRTQLEQDGYVVLEDFLRPAECDELRQAGEDLTADLPDIEQRAIFFTGYSDKQQTEKGVSDSLANTETVNSNHETGQHSLWSLPQETRKKIRCPIHLSRNVKDTYFLDSNDKISYFFETEAIGPDGKLNVDQSISLNKVGHALHLLHPIFRCYTYSDRVKTVCNELGLKEPAVVQSMYIYKNPGIGGEVVAHQDATFLYTEPVPPVGFWIALEDATVQNGCLWMARGSHKSGVHRRLVRNPDKESKQTLIYDRPAAVYPQSSFTPVPVSKGTCILIHGNVVHKSAPNKSEKSRHAYTFHVIEKQNNAFSNENWLQEGENAPFLNLYTTPQII